MFDSHQEPQPLIMSCDYTLPTDTQDDRSEGNITVLEKE